MAGERIGLVCGIACYLARAQCDPGNRNPNCLRSEGKGRLASERTSAEQVSTESGNDRVNNDLDGHCPLTRPGRYRSRY